MVIIFLATTIYIYKFTAKERLLEFLFEGFVFGLFSFYHQIVELTDLLVPEVVQIIGVQIAAQDGRRFQLVDAQLFG